MKNGLSPDESLQVDVQKLFTTVNSILIFQLFFSSASNTSLYTLMLFSGLYILKPVYFKLSILYSCHTKQSRWVVKMLKSFQKYQVSLISVLPIYHCQTAKRNRSKRKSARHRRFKGCLQVFFPPPPQIYHSYKSELSGLITF